MKERNARRLIASLLGLALFSIWWMAFSLHRIGPSAQDPPILQRLPSKSNEMFRLASSNASKPYFVLHVGPPKTATTSIQCVLDALSAELAEKDSYYFVGKGCPKANNTMANGESGIPGHLLMMGLIDANPHSRGFEKLKERMEHHLALGNHMIFSLEAMSNHLEDRPETWDLFLSLFEGWNVRIVVAYRHYFDWIRSMYYQQHIGRRYREQWPHQKGLMHPSFQDFLIYHLKRWEDGDPSNDSHSWGQHLSLYAVQYFGKHFRDVQVFDLHQEGEVPTNFVCQMLPRANNMCHRLQNDPFTEANVKRESHCFDADRLAMAAYKGSMVDKNIYRANVVKQTQAQLLATKDMEDHSKTACFPDRLLTKFLNASLWFERQVALSKPGGGDPNLVFRRNDTNHRESFNQAISTGKFCEINTTAMLQLDRWKRFFTDIKPQKKKEK